MPQSITIELPMVLSGLGGLTLVRPIGFPDIALASGNQEAAIRAVRRRVIKRCSEFLGSQLVNCLVRGAAEKQSIEVAIAPEKQSEAWRDPIHLTFDALVWKQGESMLVAYIPPLDLTVLATPQTNLEKLVQEQIRSAIRRRGIWSLVGLARMNQTNDIGLLTESLPVQVPTPAEFARSQQDKPKSKTPTLSSVATRLKRKGLQPAHFRDEEVQQLGRLLSSSQSRSVLLVGPSGVGKTAVFHDWVRRRAKLDPSMASVSCWATDGSRLISGQTGFGMWQQQCLQMAEEVRRYPSVLHLGNLAELCESGRLRGSGGCGALLAPRLADGSMRAVIECTPEQLTRISRVEPRLVQSLTILNVEEPSSEQTRSILLEAAASWRPIDITEQKNLRTMKGRKRRQALAAQRSRVLPNVHPEALQVLDRLHRRFRTDAAAPGRPLAFFHAVMSELEPGDSLDTKRVIEAFGRQTGLPSFLIDDSVRPELASIQQQLMSQVIGQDTVIETLVDMVATLAADLSRGDRPLASMMLIGPTGVGKTETAKALARLIYSDVSRLVRIDMSELSSPSAVGRLIGDAVHPEGLLTSAVRAQPFSLVLLDEFEKAHPSVFDLLLQVLGEGRLTDGRGRLADFRNSIVMMTSNLGVDSFRAQPLGLADTQQQQRYHNHFERQVRDFLRPEMFNRIDRILTYGPLDQSTVEKIAVLRFDEFKRRDGWQSHGDCFDIDAAAMKAIIKDGYQPQYGARPLTRSIERNVVVPLADAICHAGRSRKIDVAVTTKQEEDSDRVLVNVRTHAENEKRDQQSVLAVVGEMTTLRRRAQALDRCEAVRRLRNQFTMVTRKMKALLRTAKKDEERERIRFGPLGVDRMQTRERMIHVRGLCQEIDSAEAKLLAKYYRGDVIDEQHAASEIANLRERLWNLLCELQSDSVKENERTTLILTARDFAPANGLLKAYRRLCREKEWNLQTHALLRRSDAHTLLDSDRVIECPGWSEEPAFRVSTDKDQVEAVLGTWISSSLPLAPGKPSMAAYRLIRQDALTDPPAGTIGLMLTFRGKHAGLMMRGEAGVHSFKLSGDSRSSGYSMFVSNHKGMPIEYLAPEWLPRGDFQLNGHPRRWYDLSDRMVRDLVDSESRPVKMDREGRWLENLIEQDTERRIWAELDQDDTEPSAPEATVVITN
ncbi:MAG: AAA family ATPase [Rubripirellula sp.]